MLAVHTFPGSAATLQKKRAADRPNIIYIMADDLGYGDLHCFNADSQIPTPYLDQLRAQGMAFTDIHSGTSVSTPSRYGIMTGRYCFRTSLKKGVLWGYSEPLIEKERLTVAELLRQAGYTTAVIGKWHLGLGWVKEDPDKAIVGGNMMNPEWVNIDFAAPLTDSPNDHGFDYSFILPGSLDMNPYVYIENGSVTVPEMRMIQGSNKPRGVFYRKGLCAKDVEVTGVLDKLKEQAISYIGEQRSDRPFFLYLPLTAPHAPWLPAPEFRGRSKAGIYGDFVCHVDDVVGRVLEALDKQGLADNTIVIFTSDNGADWTPQDKVKFPEHQANYIFRGYKTDVWDGGHRIPFIVRWPGVVPAGSHTDQTLCLTDLMATCADLTGTPLPEGVGEDSYSFLPILRDSANGKSVRTSTIHVSTQGVFAIREGRWKYIDSNKSGGNSDKVETPYEVPGQLYDMESDPREQHNLYEKYPQVVAALKAKLEQIKLRGGEDVPVCVTAEMEQMH